MRTTNETMDNSHSQQRELPCILVLVNVGASFNIEKDEYLHSSVIFSETWSIPCGLCAEPYEQWQISPAKERTDMIHLILYHILAQRVQRLIVIPFTFAFCRRFRSRARIWVDGLARRPEGCCIFFDAFLKFSFICVISLKDIEFRHRIQAWQVGCSPSGMNFFNVPSTSSTVDVDGNFSE